MSNSTDRKVSIGAYIALAAAIIFFSGLLQGKGALSVFDFNTLNGSFGTMANAVTESADGINVTTTTMRGAGGFGARDGFMFALTLVPTVMFAMGMIAVFEHYGALEAARKLLTPLLRPLASIPGSTGMALIASLQSTDAGSAMTRQLSDDGELTKRETDIFAMFQFTAGATIVNAFSSGAVLYTLTNSAGESVVPTSIAFAVGIMFIFKFVGANLFKLYLNLTEGKAGKKAVETAIEGEKA